MKNPARFIVPLLAVTFLTQSAFARRIPITRAGSIPDDLREVAGQGDGVLQRLKAFPHRPWLTGSSIALLPGEKRVVIADTDNRAVVVVDVETRVVQHRVAVGRMPERLVVAPDGRVFVTNRGSRSISVVDPVKGAEIRTVSAGVEPYGLALSPDARLLLVAASASGEVIALDTETFSVRFRVDMPETWPAAVAFHPDGRRAFVTHFFGGKVDVIDVERQRVTKSLDLPTHDSGLPGRLLGRTDAERTPNLAVSAVVSPGGTRLHVAHVMANTGAAQAASVGIGGYGLGAPSPLVASVSTFDLDTGKLMRPPVDFTRRSHDNGASMADLQVQQIQQPVAIVPDPRHARLFLVGMGSDRLITLDSSSADPITEPLQTVQVAAAPKGVAITSDGRRAFVHNAHAYHVSDVDLTSSGLTSARAFNNVARKSFEFAKNPLPEDVARGRRLFTFALDGRIGGANRFACASCHPDGRQDGLTWQVSVGPRQTPILADRLAGTGPFNWLGTEDKLEDNIKKTMVRLGGSALEEEEVRDLAKYLQHYMPSLDNPHRQGGGRGDVAAGRAIFESEETGCSGCHDPGNRYTDAALHEVGTTSEIEVMLWKRFGARPPQPGGPPQGSPPRILEDDFHIEQRVVPAEPPAEAPVAYNTPSLKHLWASAPYYHDGSQTTLRDLITHGNKGDRMGKTSHLSSRQVDHLVAYLKTL